MSNQVLKEITKVRQRDKDSHKRWFTCRDADLFTWFDGEHFTSFEFCYDKHKSEHSLFWSNKNGFSHARIDDGEEGFFEHKKSPIHVQNGKIDIDYIHKVFNELSVNIEPAIKEFILERLDDITSH